MISFPLLTQDRDGPVFQNRLIPVTDNPGSFVVKSVEFCTTNCWCDLMIAHNLSKVSTFGPGTKRWRFRIVHFDLKSSVLLGSSILCPIRNKILKFCFGQLISHINITYVCAKRRGRHRNSEINTACIETNDGLANRLAKKIKQFQLCSRYYWFKDYGISRILLTWFHLIMKRNHLTDAVSWMRIKMPGPTVYFVPVGYFND